MVPYKRLTKGVVTDLIAAHNKYVQECRDKQAAYGRALFDPGMKDVEGAHVHNSLVGLMNEIRTALAKSMIRVKFTCLDGHGATSMAMYREGDTYALGFVGWNAYTSKYYLSSPIIRNEKYGEDKDESWMVMSLDKDRIVKAVKRYCMPIKPALVIDQFWGNCMAYLNSAYSQAEKEFNELLDKRLTSSVAIEALSRVMRGEQLDPQIADIVREYESLRVEASAEKAVRTNLVCMMFSQLPSGVTLVQFRQAASIHYDAGLCRYISKYSEKSEDMKSYTTTNTLPESIMGKVSILSMFDRAKYVRGSGYIANPNVFFIEMSVEEERALRVGCVL